MLTGQPEVCKKNSASLVVFLYSNDWIFSIQMAGKQKIDVEDMAEKIYKIFKKVGML